MVLNLCSLIHVFPISDDVMYFFNDSSSQSVSLTALKKQNILKQHSQFLVKSLELAQSQANKIVKLISVDSGVVGLKKMAKDDFLDKARFIITHNIMNKNPFCSVCLKTFYNRKDRNNHMKVIHTDAKDVQFSCKLCEKSYMSKSALQYHVDILHTTKSPNVICSVCDAPFGHKLSLKRHMKVHEQAPTVHKCKMCEKEFNRKDSLTAHLKAVHKLVNYDIDMVKLFRQDDGSFKCEICQQVFSGEEADKNLADHLSLKCNNVKKFICTECNQNFSRKFNLEEHKRKFHSMEPQNIIKCEHCEFATKHKNSLRRHMKRIHNNDVLK